MRVRYLLRTANGLVEFTGDNLEEIARAVKAYRRACDRAKEELLEEAAWPEYLTGRETPPERPEDV